MTTSTYAIHTYLTKLGLEAEVANLYMALYTFGPQSISQLARSANIERTRVYRLIETLKEASLVDIETHYKRSVYKAAHIGNLQSLLSKREQELRNLQGELQRVEKNFSQQNATSPPTTVQFYQGLDGNKQMFWNQTRAKGEIAAILYENMQNKTNSAYFERWVRRCNQNDLKFKGIIGRHFVETQQEWYATHGNERLKNWESRYIDPQIFPITHSVVTYDDIVAYHNWKDGEVFGIEICNQQIADAQRRVFAMLWQQAVPVDDVTGISTTV